MIHHTSVLEDFDDYVLMRFLSSSCTFLSLSLSPQAPRLPAQQLGKPSTQHLGPLGKRRAPKDEGHHLPCTDNVRDARAGSEHVSKPQCSAP